MSDFVFKLNTEGVNELLRCDEMRAIIEGHAEEMAAELGDGYSYEMGTSTKDGRVRAIVKTDSDTAKKENLEKNTLLKAVGGQSG